MTKILFNIDGIELDGDQLAAAAPHLYTACKYFLREVMDKEDGMDNLLDAAEHISTAVRLAERQKP